MSSRISTSILAVCLNTPSSRQQRHTEIVFDPGEDEIVLDFLLEMDAGERKSLDGLDVDLILGKLTY